MNCPKSANKFMMCFLLYNCAAVFIIAIASIQLSMTGMDAKDIMQFMLLSQDVIVFMVPMAAYIIITGEPFKKLVPLKRLSLKNALYVSAITLLIMPMMSVFSQITNMFVSSDVNESFQTVMLDFPWWVSVIYMAVMPPLCEETMFRGYILTGYKKTGFAKATLVSALFFGMMHLDLYQLPYATFAGIVMAGFVFYTGSIYSSMLAHFIVNGSQTAMFLISTKLMDRAELEKQLAAEVGADEQLATLYVTMAVMIFCLPLLLFLINRFVRRNRDNYAAYCTDGAEDIPLYFEERVEKQKIFDKFFVLSVIIYIAYVAIFK